MFINKRQFGLYLAKKRLQLGVSQSDVGKALGVSGQYVSNWERGASTPPVNKLPQLAEILEIPVEEMINLIADETRAHLQTAFSQRTIRRRGLRKEE